MENTVLKTEKLYTVNEVSDLLKKSERWIQKLCKHGKLEAITVVDNGGQQYRISESAVKAFALNNNIPLFQTNSILTPEQGVVCTTSQVQAELCLTGSAQLPVPFSLNKKVEVNKVIPEAAKRIALARCDLIKAWEEFRNKAEKKTDADKNFLALYNSKIYYPAIYQVLGDVSNGTLYRWKKEFKEIGNYTALLPQYNYRSVFEKETKLSEVERKYFLDLLLQPRNISVGNAVRLIKFILEKQGIYEICSYSTYKRFADWFKSKHYDVWVLMREGQKALVDKVAPYVERDASLLEVGDVFVADGHVLDFQVINPFTGKPCRAILVAYKDWKSTDIAGYEIMLTENTQCIASALRNAIISLGKIPKISYQDNGKSFRAKFFSDTKKNLDECGFHGLFGRLGIVPVFAQPYNAKAKTIERTFREFTQTGESLMPSYVGNNIANKPAYMMRNEKFHKKIHNTFIPTLEQARHYVNCWLEFYRSQPCPNVPGKTIGEVFNEGKGSGLDIDLLDDLMMAEEIRKVGRNGVKFLNNHYYSQDLYGIKDKIILKYSLFDLSYIKAYTQNGEYICKAETVLKVHPMAAYLGEEKDVYSLKRAIKTSKKVQKQTIDDSRKLLPKVDKKLLEWQKALENKDIKKIETKKQKEPEYEFKAEPIPVIKNQQEDYKWIVNTGL